MRALAVYKMELVNRDVHLFLYTDLLQLGCFREVGIRLLEAL